MSFKGITWAGNVYQKFEAMCLEVEEAMYQDTVKYMENQVQKVGVSVKKFCSEVMDDVRPLSCIDPTSVASDDMSLISYGFADVNKKPTPGILDEHWDLKKENQDQVFSNLTAEKRSSDVVLFSPQSPGIFIEHKSPEKSAASKKIGVQRHAIGIKRISKSNQPSKDSCRSTSGSGDRRSKVANSDTRARWRVASDNSGATSSSDFGGRRGSGGTVKENSPNLDPPIASSARHSSRAACDDSIRTSSSNIVLQETGEAVKGYTASPASEKVSKDSSRVASDDTGATPSSDLGGRRGSGEAVKGNALNLDPTVESPGPCISRVACDDSTVTLSSNVVMKKTSEAVNGNTALQDNLIDSPASEKVSLAESTMQIEDVSNCIPPVSNNNLSDEPARLKGDPEPTTSCSAETTGASLNDVAASSSFRSEVCNLEYEEKEVPAFNEGTSVKDCSSSADSPLCNAESCDEDSTMSNKDSFDIEFVENDEVSEVRLEKFEIDTGRYDLEGSCIFVEGDELDFDLQGIKKHKSYKKRIREALSSKLRSRKDNQMPDRVLAVDSEERRLSACDSDWELL